MLHLSLTIIDILGTIDYWLIQPQGGTLKLEGDLLWQDQVQAWVQGQGS